MFSVINKQSNCSLGHSFNRSFLFRTRNDNNDGSLKLFGKLQLTQCVNSILRFFFFSQSPWYYYCTLDTYCIQYKKCQKVNTVCALSHNECHVCFGWKHSIWVLTYSLCLSPNIRLVRSFLFSLTLPFCIPFVYFHPFSSFTLQFHIDVHNCQCENTVCVNTTREQQYTEFAVVNSNVFPLLFEHRRLTIDVNLVEMVEKLPQCMQP